MKFFKCIIVIAIVASSRLFATSSPDDTLELAGPNAGFKFGWFGEAWKGAAWCNDVLVPDAHRDTSIAKPDTMKGMNIVGYPVKDTTTRDSSVTTVDTLVITMFTITKTTYIRTTPTDTIVDRITVITTIMDSSIVNVCQKTGSDFVTDTGGFTPATNYMNYFYRYRNYWAQLPLVWNDWGGKDSLTVCPFNKLLVTYKGVLPQHQLNLEFFYSSWGSAKPDIDKGLLKMGDGVGILLPTTTWKTVILTIPDSVSLPGITGLNFRIENSPGAGGGSISEVGNLKVARVALFKDPTAIRRSVTSRNLINDRFHFMPKSAGKVVVSLFSLEGRLLCSKSISVDPKTQYSVRSLASRTLGASSAQMRIVKIEGVGVSLREKIW